MAVSALFVWLVVRGVNATAAFDELRQADPIFCAPAAVVLMAGIWVRAVRWRVLLRPVGNVGTSASFRERMTISILYCRLYGVPRVLSPESEGSLNWATTIRMATRIGRK